MIIELNKEQAEKLGLKENQKIRILTEDSWFYPAKAYAMVINIDGRPTIFALGSSKEWALKNSLRTQSKEFIKQKEKEKAIYYIQLTDNAYKFINRFGDFDGKNFPKLKPKKGYTVEGKRSDEIYTYDE